MDKVPGARWVGGRLRRIIEDFVDKFPDSTKVAEAILGVTPTNLTPQQVDACFQPERLLALRNEILACCGAPQVEAWAPGISAEVIEAYCSATGDPDSILGSWLRHGAPIGLLHPVTPTGVFPPVDRKEPTVDLNELISDPRGWSNHSSAEAEVEKVLELLRLDVNKKHGRIFDTWKDLVDAVGSEDITLNKFALVTKKKPDGSIKYRIVWDLRVSRVNERVSQGERIVLPRLLDVVNDVVKLAQHLEVGEELWFVGIVIADAFSNVLVNPDEKRYLCAAIGGKFVVFDSLVFGSGSSPTIWGRYGAWLGRSLAALFDSSEFRSQLYVDDPLFSIRGTRAAAVRRATVAFLWIAVCGFPVAWHKAGGGKRLVWIGAALEIKRFEVEIAIPEKKVEEMASALRPLLRQPTVSRRSLRSLCGSLSFAAGLVTFIRPFLSSMWAALGVPGVEAHSDAALPTPGRTRLKKKLPAHLIFTKQFAHSTRWLLAFFAEAPGPLARIFPLFFDETRQCLHISTDASPWGIGGVLVINGVIAAWFADGISDADLRHFNARRGESAYNTVWEALAILVAVRLWRLPSHQSAFLHVRSDSLGALSALSKLSSSERSLNMIARELALDWAQLLKPPTVYEHTPGIANVLPDILSRLEAPSPHEFPDILRAVPGGRPPQRDSSFWRCSSAPRL